MSSPVRSYFVLVVLSTCIATYGLLSNSTAVVIGAMLVAPLMGPIFGIALSLISGAKRMLTRSVFSESVGVVLVVLFSFILMRFGPDVDLGSEVLSRTKPTILDIGIALASGLAGAFALVSERVNAALPGVAISTALVPPLAACGICLGAGEAGLAGGAFLLFFANFLAIELAAALVFSIYGLRRRRVSNGWKSVFKQFGWTATLLLIMSFFFYRTLSATIRENSLRSEVGSALRSISTEIVGARLDDYSVIHGQDGLEVTAVYLTPKSIAPETVAEIEDHLSEQTNANVSLVVRSLQSSDADKSGPVYIESETLAARARARDQAAYFESLRDTTVRYLSTLTGASLAQLELPLGSDGLDVIVVVNTPTALSPTQVAELEDRLKVASGKQLQLKVRSLITIDVDRNKYIYAPEDPPAPSPEQLALTDRLTQIMERRIPTVVEGAFLVSLTATRQEEVWLVDVVSRTPSPITPAMVNKMQDDLIRFVDPEIQLSVRSVLEAEATAGGYRNGEG